MSAKNSTMFQNVIYFCVCHRNCWKKNYINHRFQSNDTWHNSNNLNFNNLTLHYYYIIGKNWCNGKRWIMYVVKCKYSTAHTITKTNHILYIYFNLDCVRLRTSSQKIQQQLYQELNPFQVFRTDFQTNFASIAQIKDNSIVGIIQ